MASKNLLETIRHLMPTENPAQAAQTPSGAGGVTTSTLPEGMGEAANYAPMVILILGISLVVAVALRSRNQPPMLGGMQENPDQWEENQQQYQQQNGAVPNYGSGFQADW